MQALYYRIQELTARLAEVDAAEEDMQNDYDDLPFLGSLMAERVEIEEEIDELEKMLASLPHPPSQDADEAAAALSSACAESDEAAAALSSACAESDEAAAALSSACAESVLTTPLSELIPSVSDDEDSPGPRLPLRRQGSISADYDKVPDQWPAAFHQTHGGSERGGGSIWSASAAVAADTPCLCKDGCQRSQNRYLMKPCKVFVAYMVSYKPTATRLASDIEINRRQMVGYPEGHPFLADRRRWDAVYQKIVPVPDEEDD